ncbi:MAG: endonuclease III [Chlamydiales bacterium]
MNREKRAILVQKILSDYFPNPSIPLQFSSKYTLLIAVILSAQCTDFRVNQITPLLFAKASTPQQMLKLSINEIAQIIRPCGLFNFKAKSIHTLSQILLDTHNGEVPSNRESLEKLPGVGRKTASVILSQAFGIPAFPVDTHIHRCAKRWGLSSGKSVIQTELDLTNLFAKEDWNLLHLQMIYYAREFCTAKKHIITQCPICSQLHYAF